MWGGCGERARARLRLLRLVAAAMAALAHSGRAQQLPPECADDQDGALASFAGGCAALVPHLGCTIDLNTVSPTIPVGTLVSDLCPVSCDACPAAGEESARPGCGRNSNGVGVIDSAEIAYRAADMPDVAGIRIADPEWRRAWNVIDCRCKGCYFLVFCAHC
eukprot:SAG31_NODE_1679_length_7544_cov_3.239758_5_plen_162_part_00